MAVAGAAFARPSPCRGLTLALAAAGVSAFVLPATMAPVPAGAAQLAPPSAHSELAEAQLLVAWDEMNLPTKLLTLFFMAAFLVNIVALVTGWRRGSARRCRPLEVTIASEV
ncbi:unnamed protein product [Effrenium voratum]|nr:unnamed protein product [Effrenium voratum]